MPIPEISGTAPAVANGGRSYNDDPLPPYFQVAQDVQVAPAAASAISRMPVPFVTVDYEAQVAQMFADLEQLLSLELV